MRNQLLIFLLFATIKCYSQPGSWVKNLDPHSFAVKRSSNYHTPEDKGPYNDDDPTVIIARTIANDTVSFHIYPDYKAGGYNYLVLERKYSDWDKVGINQIEQLSPTILCYKGIPSYTEGIFYLPQPLLLEYLDSTWNTITQVDLWTQRPYQKLDNKALNYSFFDAEGVRVIPYEKQVNPLSPDSYSLLTHVSAEGNFVIVNYELRSMLESNIIKVEHTLEIYDLMGRLIYVVQLPSVDGAVISNNGDYLLYTFGGIGLANVNQPFATIEREGWALMHLPDNKIVYSEFTDDGKLAFARIWKEQNLLRIAYSTPSTEIDYDYWVFYDEATHNIYTHQLTSAERLILRSDYTLYQDNFKYQDYFKKFNFRQLNIQ